MDTRWPERRRFVRGVVPRKCNGEGFVIALCVLVTVLLAATGYWVVLPRVRALLGGTATIAGSGSGKAEPVTKL